MATRPWAVPAEVIEYTEFEAVRQRDEFKLQTDIERAEQLIINYTNNHFQDDEYRELPSSVKTAVIIAAEAYAYNAASGESGNMKSESFDDYSYTVKDSGVSVKSLDVCPLLDDYVILAENTAVKLRKL